MLSVSDRTYFSICTNKTTKKKVLFYGRNSLHLLIVVQCWVTIILFYVVLGFEFEFSENLAEKRRENKINVCTMGYVM